MNLVVLVMIYDDYFEHVRMMNVLFYNTDDRVLGSNPVLYTLRMYLTQTILNRILNRYIGNTTHRSTAGLLYLNNILSKIECLFPLFEVIDLIHPQWRQ